MVLFSKRCLGLFFVFMSQSFHGPDYNTSSARFSPNKGGRSSISTNTSIAEPTANVNSREEAFVIRENKSVYEKITSRLT